MNITEEDITLLKNDEMKSYFPQSAANLEALEVEEDNEKKIEYAKNILLNFPKEKSLFILKTNDTLKSTFEALGSDVEQVTDLDSFVNLVASNEEAKSKLKNALENNDTKENTEEEGEEDPWIKKTLSILRSKNLY
jgi:hypothetical protein